MGSVLQRSYRAVLGLFNDPAIEREHGVASRGGAKMRRISEVHAGFRAVESFSEPAGVLEGEAGQSRESAEYHCNRFRRIAVDAVQDTSALR